MKFGLQQNYSQANTAKTSVAIDKMLERLDTD